MEQQPSHTEPLCADLRSFILSLSANIETALEPQTFKDMKGGFSLKKCILPHRAIEEAIEDCLDYDEVQIYRLIDYIEGEKELVARDIELCKSRMSVFALMKQILNHDREETHKRFVIQKGILEFTATILKMALIDKMEKSEVTAGH